jgi:hypothetical protein
MQAVVFMAFFAAAWWVAGVLGGHQFTGLAAIGPVVSVVMVLAARARLSDAPAADPAHKKRRNRIVGWAAGLEGLAIFVAANFLNRNGLGDYIFPVVAIIVGLHFLPMAKLLPMGIYYLSAALLVAVGVVGLFVPAMDRPFAVGVSAAIVLWITCLARLAKSPAPSPAA